ncbi:MAG: hypothetical protein MJ137_08105 [Clostridia bacterium]|nr:hypothetical protein [Clostridia bacterium]
MNTAGKQLRILFIGNSHTYKNCLPEVLKDIAAKDGIDVIPAMIAHGGWSLEKHCGEPEAACNIRLGRYDYVVLQEHTHPFAERCEYLGAVKRLDEMIRAAHARTVIYMTWAAKKAPENQAEITALQTESASVTGALLANVGEQLWQQSPEFINGFFAPDGEHPSAQGTAFAAGIIWDVIREDMGKL